MKTRSKWTPEEDNFLVQAIKANPQNKNKAFKECAKTISHSPKSCSNRWYKFLGNPKHKLYVGCLFLTKAHNEVMYKEINTPSKQTKEKITIWVKIKQLFKS